MSNSWKDLGLTYEEALHGMQSGVFHEMNKGADKSTTPKHLRVGINSSMISDAALAYLLIKKGIITEEEYKEELRLVANNELALYESRHPGIIFR